MEFSKDELKTYTKEYQVKGREALAKSRSRKTDLKESAKAYSQYLDCQAMIRNINYKVNHDTWLYDDLPNGKLVKYFRVTASGDPNRQGQLVDAFGRICVPRERNET
jgi:hypothetical protein|tara:strand:- start:1250 stop:1570 length:321 start_codon:yes stop_codon:yes gene_type:complete